MGAVRWVPAAILAVGLGVGMPGALLLARVAPDDQQVRHVRPAQTHEMVHEVHPEGARLQADRIPLEEAQAAQSQAQREAELIRLIRELELKLAELRERTVDRERPVLDEVRREVNQATRELRDVATRTARERAQHAVEAHALASDLEAARKLTARGLMSESQLRDKERLVAELENRRADQRVHVEDRVHAEVADAIRQTERTRQLVERGLLPARELDALKLKVEEMVKHQAGQQAHADEARRHLEQTMTALQQRGNARERLDLLEQRRAREVVPERADATGQFEDTSRVITSGDVLRITITGEPDLPPTYQVRTDGTVRIPLLGAFKVVGQTTQQVKDSIGRKLSDLRLGSASAVTIQVRRATRVR